MKYDKLLAAWTDAQLIERIDVAARRIGSTRSDIVRRGVELELRRIEKSERQELERMPV